METLLGRYKNLIVLAAILFAQLIALAVQVRRPSQAGEIRLVRVWTIAAVTPFEKALVHTQNWFHDKWTGYLYLHGVREENEQLRSQIEQMKLEQARMAEDANMARRIQTLLAFKEQYIENTIAAQVIGSSGSEQSRILYIDKGSDDGVKPDMAVITPTGIVGKVVQVSPGSAQVLPINDQLSGVGAALKDSRLQGILKGAPNGTTTLQYIMADEPVKPGEEVITSGGDRIFPKGLEVGKVVSAEPGKDLFLNIRVIPSARLDRLEEVLIITKIQDKLPDTKDLGPIRASDILSQRLPGVPTTPGVDASGNVITQPGANPAAGTSALGAAAGSNSAAPGQTASKPNVSAGGVASKPTVPAGGITSRPTVPAGQVTPRSSPAASGVGGNAVNPGKPASPAGVGTTAKPASSTAPPTSTAPKPNTATGQSSKPGASTESSSENPSRPAAAPPDPNQPAPPSPKPAEIPPQ
jgi:rod shape-determining protein MreC